MLGFRDKTGLLHHGNLRLKGSSVRVPEAGNTASETHGKKICSLNLNLKP